MHKVLGFSIVRQELYNSIVRLICIVPINVLTSLVVIDAFITYGKGTNIPQLTVSQTTSVNWWFALRP